MAYASTLDFLVKEGREQMKKVLITGGAGFIGSEIVNQLHGLNDYEITVFDNLSPQIHGNIGEDSYLFKRIEGKCNFVKGDICDYNSVRDVIDDNEVIIHLAAETGTGQSMYEINRYNEVNIMGTSNLLQAISYKAGASKVSKIILASSRSVYGEGKYMCKNCGEVYPQARLKERMIKKDFSLYCERCGSIVSPALTTEDSKISPNSLYAFTKYSQEKMLETMCPALNVDYTIFRFQNVYGVGQSLKNPYTGILSIFSTLLLQNKPVNIFEDGKESRDFVNVSDVARGVISSIEREATNGETINIGSGVGMTVMDIAETLKTAYHSSSELQITGDFRVGDIAYNVADIAKAHRLLDYRPEISFDKGISAFCEWVKGQSEEDCGYENSLLEMEKSGLFIKA